MNVTFDPVERVRTLIARGLDFADAARVFEGDTLEIEDDRRDYGEIRIICFGRLAGRLVVIGYIPRGTDRHIFSSVGIRRIAGIDRGHAFEVHRPSRWTTPVGF